MTISPYLLTVVFAWIIAQGAKYIIMALKHRKLDNFRHLYLSGNMPSAHTATVVSLATLIGLRDGIESTVFAVSALLAGVVMYDAVMVRRSVGEQGVAVQKLIKAQKSKIELPRAAKGHSPIEVVVGALLGVLIGFVMYFVG